MKERKKEEVNKQKKEERTSAHEVSKNENCFRMKKLYSLGYNLKEWEASIVGFSLSTCKILLNQVHALFLKIDSVWNIDNCACVQW